MVAPQVRAAGDRAWLRAAGREQAERDAAYERIAKQARELKS